MDNIFIIHHQVITAHNTTIVYWLCDILFFKTKQFKTTALWYGKTTISPWIMSVAVVVMKKSFQSALFWLCPLQNVVMLMSDFVDWLIPDIPKDISLQMHKEKVMMVEHFMKEQGQRLVANYNQDNCASTSPVGDSPTQPRSRPITHINWRNVCFCMLTGKRLKNAECSSLPLKRCFFFGYITQQTRHCITEH